jgi:hypothetical protein
VFEIPEEKTVGDAPFELEATASSALPVSFQVEGTGVVTITGNQVTINGPGTVTITAVQEGNENYESSSVSRVLEVHHVLAIEKSLPFSLYPNPTPSILNLETQEGIKQIAVFDDQGRVYRVSWNRRQVDLSGLGSGCYYLRITVGDTTYKTKIIKI